MFVFVYEFVAFKCSNAQHVVLQAGYLHLLLVKFFGRKYFGTKNETELRQPQTGHDLNAQIGAVKTFLDAAFQVVYNFA